MFYALVDVASFGFTCWHSSLLLFAMSLFAAGRTELVPETMQTLVVGC